MVKEMGANSAPHVRTRSFLKECFFQRQLLFMVIPGIVIVFIF